MTFCRTEPETISRMEKAGHSIVVEACSQWRRRLSACVRAHAGRRLSACVRAPLTVDILSTFCGVFMVQFVLS